MLRMSSPGPYRAFGVASPRPSRPPEHRGWCDELATRIWGVATGPEVPTAARQNKAEMFKKTKALSLASAVLSMN